MIKIPLLRPFVAPEATGLVAEVIQSGWIGHGPRVSEFEAQIQSLIRNPTFVMLDSCTSALYLSLQLAGIGPGDEVISTPMTCVATNLPVLHRGAEVVWADISLDGTISAESIERCITQRTKALIVVHFGGLPCDLSRIREIARDHSLWLIEDSAHALGASYNGDPIGSRGDFVCFSFQAVKTLTTVDGGGISFRSEELYERAKKLRWFGFGRENPLRYEADLEEPGFRFISNDVAAAIGLANLAHFDRNNQRRSRIAQIYHSELSNLHGLTLCQPIDGRRSSTHWLFPILVRDKQSFIQKLRRVGIESHPVHFRNDRYSVFSGARRDTQEGLSQWERHMTCIPIGHWLEDSDVAYIVETIRREI